MTPMELSVIIPTYNRGQLLKEMLATLSEQTYPVQQFEVIVVVDGSTDGTWELLQQLRTPYPLRTLYQTQAGPSRARNCGAISARGAVLLFLDDDLLPQPQLLMEHARIHQKDPDAVVLGRFLPSESNNKGGWHVWEERVFEKHYRAMVQGRRPPAGRRLYSGNFSLRRRHFLAVGGFDERLRRAEDVELGFRLEKVGFRFYFNPEAAAVHRGYHSFSSWCQSAYLYGRSALGPVDKNGHRQALSEILSWYHRQPQAARLIVWTFLGRDRIRKALLQALQHGAATLHKSKLTGLAHYGYSSIFKLQYWQGVADELGGRSVLYQHTRQWRQHHLATESKDQHRPAEEGVAPLPGYQVEGPGNSLPGRARIQ